MGNPIFDLSDGGLIFGSSGSMGFSSDGDLMMRMSDHMAMDLETGDVHFTSCWEDDD